MKITSIFYIGIILFIAIIASTSSCTEEGVWLEFDEVKKKQSLTTYYMQDSTKMHLSPIASIIEYLKSGGVAKILKIRVVSSGVNCKCSKRKNGNCLCKLPNNKRHECNTLDDDENHVCTKEKNIQIFVEPMYEADAKRLGFE